MTIQVTQLWLDSTLYFSWLTQHRLNSNPKFANLTQLWLNSFESELSQIWLTTHHILPNLAKSFPGNVTDKCKILTFSLQKNQWLNFDSSSIQLIQLWLKWRSAWFDSDSTHIPDFHGRLNSDSTHLSHSRVKFDSRLMRRAQPCPVPPVTTDRQPTVATCHHPPVTTSSRLRHHLHGTAYHRFRLDGDRRVAYLQVV